jgi:sugar transferase (PEP-CTERM/EpsH1 system associated)
MHILFVVPYVPDPIRVRPYNLLRSLAGRGHRLSLLTLWTNDAERRWLDRLRADGIAVRALPLPAWRSALKALWAVLGRDPLQSAYSWAPGLLALGQGLGRPDIIHVEHLRGSRYGLALRRQPGGPPLVWDSVDCISQLFAQAAAYSQNPLRRAITRFELGRTRRYEGRLLSAFDHVLVTSAADRQALLALAQPGQEVAPISVVANGVDLDHFSPGASGAKEVGKLVISGKMSYHANVAMTLFFVREVLPLIWRERPETELWIVGKDPPREVAALEQNPAIAVTGEVEDLRPFLQRATVAVAPLIYGAGIQNKVLEAMACATPVVATPPAVAALETQPGADLLVAQEPAQFASQVLALLADTEAQRRIGQAGRRYVERHHGWPAVAEKVEEIYDQVVRDGR